MSNTAHTRSHCGKCGWKSSRECARENNFQHNQQIQLVELIKSDESGRTRTDRSFCNLRTPNKNQHWKPMRTPRKLVSNVNSRNPETNTSHFESSRNDPPTTALKLSLRHCNKNGGHPWRWWCHQHCWWLSSIISSRRRPHTQPGVLQLYYEDDKCVPPSKRIQCLLTLQY